MSLQICLVSTNHISWSVTTEDVTDIFVYHATKCSTLQQNNNLKGKIAQRYQDMGGVVQHFGKPHPRHFHECLHHLGMDFDTTKSIEGVAHVGDSLEHDVAGANAAGIDSVFVLGGIHAKELGLVPTGSDDVGVVIEGDHGCKGHISKLELETKLNAFFAEKGIWPTHVIPSLRLDPVLSER